MCYACLIVLQEEQKMEKILIIEDELDIQELLKNYLEEDHDFKYATVVHCDTPSGMLNDIASICRC